jgi:O-antigen/teichoic acid export membrane protein
VLIQHTLRYLPAQVLSPLAQLLSMVLWTHWLTPQDMGIFTLVTVTQEVAFLLCLNWFSVYALRYLPGPEDTAGLHRYLGTENVILVAGTALGLLVALATCWMVAPQVSGVPTWLPSSAIAAYFVTRSACAHYAERARAQSAFRAYTWLQSAGPVGGLALGLLAMEFGRADAWSLLLAYAAAQALGLLVALPLMGMRWRAFKPDRDLLDAALRFGVPTMAVGMLGWLGENYIRYLVQWKEGAVVLGLMIVGWALGRRCASVAAMMVTTAAFPLASRLLNEGRRDEALRQLRTNAALLIAVLAPVTVGIELLGPALVELTVAQEYRQVTTQMLAIAMFGAALRNLHLHATNPLLVLERRFGLVAIVDGFEIVACVLASLAGLALAGIHGAVLGQALGSALALWLSLRFASRYGFEWPVAETLKVALGCLAMAGALLWLNPPRTLVGLLAGCVLGAGVYAATMAALFWPKLRSQLAHRMPGVVVGQTRR